MHNPCWFKGVGGEGRGGGKGRGGEQLGSQIVASRCSKHMLSCAFQQSLYSQVLFYFAFTLVQLVLFLHTQNIQRSMNFVGRVSFVSWQCLVRLFSFMDECSFNTTWGMHACLQPLFAVSAHALSHVQNVFRDHFSEVGSPVY